MGMSWTSGINQMVACCSAHCAELRGTRPHRGCTKIKSGWWRCSPWVWVSGAPTEMARWRWTAAVVGVGARCLVTWTPEEWNRGQHELRWCMVVLKMPFIGRLGKRRGREGGGQLRSLTPSIMMLKRGEGSPWGIVLMRETEAVQMARLLSVGGAQESAHSGGGSASRRRG
jgi:hypothetical protein